MWYLCICQRPDNSDLFKGHGVESSWGGFCAATVAVESGVSSNGQWNLEVVVGVGDQNCKDNMAHREMNTCRSPLSPKRLSTIKKQYSDKPWWQLENYEKWLVWTRSISLLFLFLELAVYSNIAVRISNIIIMYISKVDT